MGCEEPVGEVVGLKVEKSALSYLGHISLHLTDLKLHFVSIIGQSKGNAHDASVINKPMQRSFVTAQLRRCRNNTLETRQVKNQRQYLSRRQLGFDLFNGLSGFGFIAGTEVDFGALGRQSDNS